MTENEAFEQLSLVDPLLVAFDLEIRRARVMLGNNTAALRSAYPPAPQRTRFDGPLVGCTGGAQGYRRVPDQGSLWAQSCSPPIPSSNI